MLSWAPTPMSIAPPMYSSLIRLLLRYLILIRNDIIVLSLLYAAPQYTRRTGVKILFVLRNCQDSAARSASLTVSPRSPPATEVLDSTLESTKTSWKGDPGAASVYEGSTAEQCSTGEGLETRDDDTMLRVITCPDRGNIIDFFFSAASICLRPENCSLIILRSMHLSVNSWYVWFVHQVGKIHFSHRSDPEQKNQKRSRAQDMEAFLNGTYFSSSTGLLPCRKELSLLFWTGTYSTFCMTVKTV